MTRNKIVILIIAACVLAGCMSRAKIETNKDPNFTANIQKITVIENVVADDFTNDFNKSFIKNMNACGVQLVMRSGKEKSDATLNIALTSTTRNGYGNIVGRQYELTLRDVSGKKVWKSLIDYYLSQELFGSLMENKGEKLASKIIEKMTEDDILKSCPPPQD